MAKASTRNKALVVRLTQAEHEALKAKAGDEGMSAYVRRVALEEDQTYGRRDPATLQALKDAWDSPALTEQFDPKT